jgi:hypothetical protein
MPPPCVLLEYSHGIIPAEMECVKIRFFMLVKEIIECRKYISGKVSIP